MTNHFSTSDPSRCFDVNDDAHGFVVAVDDKLLGSMVPIEP